MFEIVKHFLILTCSVDGALTKQTLIEELTTFKARCQNEAMTSDVEVFYALLFEIVIESSSTWTVMNSSMTILRDFNSSVTAIILIGFKGFDIIRKICVGRCESCGNSTRTVRFVRTKWSTSKRL